MTNKNEVCFRYKNEDGTMMYCRIYGEKLWDDGQIDDECVYVDIDNYDSIENFINALKQLKR